MALFVRDKNIELATQVLEASSFKERFFGLMGKQKLKSNTCLWIKKCNQIHTHFMRFSIDAIFIDKDMRVVKIKEAIKPWRFTLAVLTADSVIEFSSQNISTKVEEGDYLYVGN